MATTEYRGAADAVLARIEAGAYDDVSLTYEQRADALLARIEEEAKIETAQKRGALLDTGLGAVRGLVAGLHNAAVLADETDEGYLRDANDGVTIGSVRSKTALGYLADRVAAGTGWLLDDVLPETDTKIGSVSQAISSFIGGFGVAGKAMKAANWAGQAGKFALAARFAGQGFATDYVTTDHEGARVSNLIQSAPELANPITEWLAADPNDSAALGRLKVAAEGVILGEMVGAGVRVTAAAMRAARNQAGTLASTLKASAEARRLAALADETAKLQAAADAAPVPKVEAAEAVPAAVKPEPLPHLAPIAEQVAAKPEVAREIAERIIAQGGRVEAAEIATAMNAGRIDWDSIGDPGAARALFNETAAKYQTVIENAGTARESLEETAQKALDVRRSASDLKVADELIARTTGGEHSLSAHLLAGRQLTADSAADTLRLAALVKAGKATDADKAALQAAVARTAALFAATKGSGSEVARALSAMRIMAQAAKHDAARLIEAAELAGLPPPDELVTALGKTDGSMGAVAKVAAEATASRQFMWTYIYGNLLANPATHAANFLGSVMSGVLRTADLTFAAGFGAIRRILTGNPRSLAEAGVRGADIGLNLAGRVYGLHEAVGFPLRALAKAGGKFDLATFRKELAESPVATAWKSGRTQADDALATGMPGTPGVFFDTTLPAWASDNGAFLAAAARGWQGILHAGNAVGYISAYPARLMATLDTLMGRSARMGEAFMLNGRRLAMLKASGEPLDVRTIDEVLSDGTELGKFMRETANKQAKRELFQGEGGPITKGLMGLVRNVPVLRVLALPFIKTPAAILREQFIERSGGSFVWAVTRNVAGATGKAAKAAVTPDASATKAFLAELAEKYRAGGAEGDLVAARMMTGAAIMWGAWQLAASGHLVGTRRNAKGRSDSRILDGIAPGSLKVGNNYYTLGRLDPIGGLLIVMADLHDAVKLAQAAEDDALGEDLGAVALSLSVSMVRSLHSRAFLGSVGTFLDAASGNEYAITRLGQQLASLAVPLGGAVAGIERASDPVMREADTLAEYVLSRVPWASQDLAPKRDYLGRERSTLSTNMLLPVNVSQESADPVDLALADLQIAIPMPSRRIGDRKLTGAEFSELLKLRGQSREFNGSTLQEALTQLVTSEAYRAADDDDSREKAVRKIIDKYSLAARAKMRQRFAADELAERLRVAKRAAQ